MFVRNAAVFCALCSIIFAVAATSSHADDTTKIVGGEEVNINQFPWQVSLLNSDGDHFCGGTIIGRYKILTAAHCLFVLRNDTRKVQVRLGSTNRKSGGYVRQVARIVMHENFSDPTSLDNDIAILVLKYPIIYGSKIQPVALPPPGSDLDHNDTVHVSGWGSRRLAHETEFPIKLHAVAVQVVDREMCSGLYDQLKNFDIPITENMFCAGILNVGGKDACQGDSGGPVVQLGSTKIIYGIVSWGYGCAYPSYPGVYTRVSRYIDWIDEV